MRLIKSIIYVSRATQHLDKINIVDILRKSRRRNSLLNITGVLLYRNTRFMQYLEGDEDDLDYVAHLIQTDKSHHEYTEILTMGNRARAFPNLQMAYAESAEKLNNSLKSSRYTYSLNLDNFKLIDKLLYEFARQDRLLDPYS